MQGMHTNKTDINNNYNNNNNNINNNNNSNNNNYNNINWNNLFNIFVQTDYVDDGLTGTNIKFVELLLKFLTIAYRSFNIIINHSKSTIIANTKNSTLIEIIQNISKN